MPELDTLPYDEQEQLICDCGCKLFIELSTIGFNISRYKEQTPERAVRERKRRIMVDVFAPSDVEGKGHPKIVKCANCPTTWVWKGGPNPFVKMERSEYMSEAKP